MDLSQFGVVDPQILKMLQDAYAANPTLRTSLGEGEAGMLYGIDPRARQGDYYLNLDEQGRPLIYKDLERNTWGQDSAMAYDMNGNPVGMSSGDSTALGLAKFIAASAAAYGGVNAADSFVNGAAAGAGSGAGAGSQLTMPTGTDLFAPTLDTGATLTGGSTLTGGAPAFGTTLADAGIGLGGGGAWGASLAGQTYGGFMPDVGGGASSMFPSSGNPSMPNTPNNPNTPNTPSAPQNQGSSPSSQFPNLKLDPTTGQLIGAGLGAVAGALDSQDKEQTATRDPWSKAQPFLEQLLGQGQQLATRYQQQPFSPAQQQAYANMGGLLGGINQSMPGLLSQMSSQQQFVRGGQPTRTQGVNLQWQPGLLGQYGT